MTDWFKVDHNLRMNERELEQLAQGLLDLRPFWPLLATRVIGWIGRQFDTEGEFWGDPWAPLSADYAAWKTVNYPGKGILSAEGDLRRAATSPRREVTPTTMTLLIEPYDKHGRELEPGWFQEGTERMPARPLIGEGLTPEMDAEIETAATFYVDDLIARLRGER